MDLADATVPQQLVGPLRLTGALGACEVSVPLATFETPLWPSVNRGARVTARADGIALTVVSECMARSVVVEAEDAAHAVASRDALLAARETVADLVAASSRFARLQDIGIEVCANLLYVRIMISTGDAAGHNMVTLAADRVLAWLLTTDRRLRHVSVSGNVCTDKKVSAVNRLLGRGRHVIAEATIPQRLCERYLKTTPAAVATLNQRKNLLGSVLAGSLHSANAHFANMLLAVYLATGQDAANIVEGSQGITTAEVRDNALYFAVSLPSIIVGTVGNGKDLPYVQENLARLGCLEQREPGANARRLAGITAAVVLCGELSLLAALTNQGELMAAHQRLER
jgi:hydroxymethylglutaryl-CoA reductase (NADPH)